MVKMAEKGARRGPKKKAHIKTEETTSATSVKTYQQGIDAEKPKMTGYSKRFGTSVRSLQADFKKHSKDLSAAALEMREEGTKKMNEKINNQIKENKEAVAKIEAGVKFLISEVNKKKKDFQTYAQGPFTDYIKAFWG